MSAAEGIPVNVLVVDDRAENRMALKAILSSPEYRIVEAGSGKDALRELLSHEFAVILLDVVMPEMNGFELAAAIRRRERTSTVPILFLTAEATELDLVCRGYEVGAVDYLVKPLVPNVVQAKVAVFAELYRKEKKIENQAALLLEAEKKQNEVRLMELQLASERRYRVLAEAVPHIVWTARPDGTVEYFNWRWFEYTGRLTLSATETWEHVVHPDDEPRWREEWRQAMSSVEMFQVECRLRRADGTFRWHLCRAVPERSATGQALSWMGTFTDIEDQKQLYQAAVAAVRLRDEFLSVASHELRTPLSSLQLQIENLLRPSRKNPAAVLCPEQLKKKLEISLRQTDRLSRLVSELMDVSRIRAGRLRLKLEEADLSAIARDVAEHLGDDAAKARTPVTVTTQTMVLGRWDRMRVEQVLTNLMTNALKFGAGKPVEVAVEGDGLTARLAVRDRGIGIPTQDLERIFGRFEQAISPRSYGGLGLGLYIARQIVDAHGGTIRAESQPGAGSTFIVELPVEPPMKQERPVVRADPEQQGTAAVDGARAAEAAAD